MRHSMCDMTLGRNHVLFQWPYIRAYYGSDFVGYDTVLEKTRKLKAIQDTLGRLGKSLIVVYAPSKADFYPEYFPDDRVEERRGITNLEAYRHAGDSLGLNQVDMDSWFLSMKNKSKELLFSKQGIHWTLYGTMLAGDSLMRYIEKLRNIRVSHPVWTKIEHTTKARYTSGDDDIALLLNTIFPVAHDTFAYPVVEDMPDSTAQKPNIIYIGDSFGYKLAGSGYINKMNTQCEVWCYFNQVVDIHNNSSTYIPFYDWHAAINKSDCIVLVYTTFTLEQFGNGFIEAAYEYYYPSKK